ncbi:MAG TPA: hypothetical protein VJR89_43755 [Polyangiales bacterium]|nr:hypothetical protein [Polyangiales bacterium]
MRSTLWLLVAIAFSGCAHERNYFRPTERVRGQTLQGYHEAFYDLVGPQGRFGEAKVWSVGSYRSGEDSVIEVGLSLHNTSGKPIELSARELELDPVRISGKTVRHLRPAETGVFRVQPEKQADVKVHFLLPGSVYPGAVTSFGLRWRVRNGDQSYAQSTPFLEESAFYPNDRSYIYYSTAWPCSPYDVHCVGFYYPYGPYPYGYGPPPPPPPPHIERRRVEVR